MPASHIDGLVVGRLNYFVIHVGAQHIRYKASAEALDLVGPWLATRKHCTVTRLNSNRSETRLAFLYILEYASNRVASAHT